MKKYSQRFARARNGLDDSKRMPNELFIGIFNGKKERALLRERRNWR